MAAAEVDERGRPERPDQQSRRLPHLSDSATAPLSHGAVKGLWDHQTEQMLPIQREGNSPPRRILPPLSSTSSFHRTVGPELSALRSGERSTLTAESRSELEDEQQNSGPAGPYSRGGEPGWSRGGAAGMADMAPRRASVAGVQGGWMRDGQERKPLSNVRIMEEASDARPSSSSWRGGGAPFHGGAGSIDRRAPGEPAMAHEWTSHAPSRSNNTNTTTSQHDDNARLVYTAPYPHQSGSNLAGGPSRLDARTSHPVPDQHAGPASLPGQIGSLPLPAARRHRVRSSTLTLPRPAVAYERVPPSHISPTYSSFPASGYASSAFRRDSNAASSTHIWDEHRHRRDSWASASTAPSYDMHTPPIHSWQQPSPVLFAPISPFSGSGQGASGLVGEEQGSRPLTPVSPLVMDGLTVEDRESPSGAPSFVEGSSARKRRSLDWGSQVREPAHHAVPLPPPVAGRPTRDLPSRYGRPLTSPPFRPHSMDEQLSVQMEAHEHLGLHQARPVHQYSHEPPAHGPMRVAGPYGQDDAPMQAQDRLAHSSRRRRRPPYSYSSLIAQAISSSSEGRMTLREIYTWISNAYPGLYAMDGPESQGWQNTVRHNLSLNKSFVKVARTAQDIYDSCASGNPAQSQAARGKGGWWMLDPAVAAGHLGPGFRSQEMDGGDPNGGEGPMSMGSGSRTSIESPLGETLSSPLGVPSPLASDVGPRADDDSSIRVTRPQALGPLVRSLPGKASQVAPHGGAQPSEQDPAVLSGGSNIPSVLLPRPRSAERRGEQSAAFSRPIIVGRARGYTTSAAEPPVKLSMTGRHVRTDELPPSESSSNVQQSPSKRKRRFWHDLALRRYPDPGSAPATLAPLAPGLSYYTPTRESTSESSAGPSLGLGLHGTSGGPLKANHPMSDDADEEAAMAASGSTNVTMMPASDVDAHQEADMVMAAQKDTEIGSELVADRDAARASPSPNAGARMAISGLLNG